MRIVVPVKEVPDTYGARVLDTETGLADRGASDAVIDEIGERALEVALSYAEAHPGTEVIALTMGPASASTSVRKALAMGAASAVHVSDEGLRGADLGTTADVLAAALRRTAFDLVVAGDQSTDGAGGVIPSMLGELLEVPVLSSMISLQITADAVSGTRAIEGGTAAVSAPLPAVVSITEALPDPRFPNFKGIMAAKKKPVETLTAAELGVEAGALSEPRAILLAVAERPPRQAGTVIVDDGEGGTTLAEYLVSNKLV